jgi:hypothetical protein
MQHAQTEKQQRRSETERDRGKQIKTKEKQRQGKGERLMQIKRGERKIETQREIEAV